MLYRKYLFFSVLVLTSTFGCSADTGIRFENEKSVFFLENDLFIREIKLDRENGDFYTVRYLDKQSGFDYISPGSKEFGLTVDGTDIDGNGCHCLVYLAHKIQNKGGSSTLDVRFSLKDLPGSETLDLTISFEIYPESKAVRKWMTLKNTGSGEIKVEDLFMEHLQMIPDLNNMADIYKSYGRQWTKAPYIGTQDDPAILVNGNRSGFIMGDEAPGIMKFMSVYSRNSEIRIGLPPSNHNYPFRRYLSPGESFKSPESFIILTSQHEPELAFESDLGSYIREHLGVKLYKHEIPPTFLYNTWNPFRININEKMIRELADSLTGTGVEYLIMDDGWQDHNGDWNPNKSKFPNGLKPVADYIRSRGMKPGLWISLTTVEDSSIAYKKFMQYAVKDQSGNAANLHGWSNNLSILTMEIASPWYKYIKDKMRNLVLEYGITYFKIDLSMVKSAYIMEPERSGSYEENEFFNGREESLYAGFEQTMQLFDELGAEFPQLIIDCTFELWGDWHIIDYALVKHADVDWISNFEAPPPIGSRTVRHLAWHHGPTIPASCMLIGNQKLEVENHEFSFISNLASTPIMLGDPRKLSVSEKKWYASMADWYRNMNRKYAAFKYYQNSGIFNKPGPHNWDGFARFNPAADGGFFCVFRNDQPDDSHTFQLPWCRENGKYEIIEAASGTSLGIFPGKILRDQGIKIGIRERNSAKALEIRPVK